MKKLYKEAQTVYMTYYGENGEVTSTDLPTKSEMKFYKGVELSTLSLMMTPFSYFGIKVFNEVSSIQDLQSVQFLLALLSILIPALLFTSSNNYLGSGIGTKDRKGSAFVASMLFATFVIIPAIVLVSRLGADGLFFIPFMISVLYLSDSIKTFKKLLSKINLVARQIIANLIYELVYILN